jgi:type I restriction enzyme M protein
MASVETFKTAIVRIRDILRGPGVSITGMDSMRHICLYLLSRYMTCSRVRSIGVPDEFAWENLIHTAQTKNGGLQKALDYFYHKEEDSLVNHFDRLFGTEKFSFDVKNPQKHKEILEILNGVKMEDVDCQMDILGWVYEQHLKTGSSAARDLGQFFTDRFICSYMVKLCSPKFKSEGVPESVCDPSMGTGGFLTAYIKYFKETYPDKPIDWAVQQKEVHGCDTDPKVAGVSRLNLFMESGGHRFENLLTHDSLYGDLPLTGYDVILANMPFGLKGIIHASCCKRVNDLKIRGTKSEPLFLQLMMLSLKRGGRCAVVVPDGMLVNTSTLHNGTRKYLLDNFNLKRVIKMKGQFFMNTGIQPSILFFENTGKGTEVVEFWDVLANERGAITETMFLSVPRAKFDASSSFDVRRYQEIEKPVADSAGFPMVKLEDLVNYENGKTLSALKKTQTGEFDVMGGGMTYIGKTDVFNREGETISISKSGASAGFVAYHNKKYWAGDCLTITPKNPKACIIKYLYYYLKLNNNLTMSNTAGSTIPHCKWDDIKHIRIPIPPIKDQIKIVECLDSIYRRKEEAQRIVNESDSLAQHQLQNLLT